MELVSPRINAENHCSGVHGAPPQSNWHFPDSREISEVGGRKPDGFDNLSLDPHQGGNILWLIQAKIPSMHSFLFLHIYKYSIFFVMELWIEQLNWMQICLLVNNCF